MIYSRSDGPGSGSTLVLEAIDGTDARELATSEHAMVTLWVPGGRTILVDERVETGGAAGSAYLLDIDTGAETPLLGYSGSLTTVQFNPDGPRALLGAESMGGGSWHLADLTTGAVGRLLQQQTGLKYPQQPVVSQDARFSLVTGQSAFEQTVWLLDAVELRATELANGRSVSALFSPDACHVAVTVETSIDGLPGFAVSVAATSGEASRDLGKGRVLTWLGA